LFIGLGLLKGAVPDLKSNPDMMSFLQSFTDLGFGTTLIFILVGTVLTVVVQSSSASTAITLVMLAQGWIDFHIAAAMVLGENLGTTITANIAAAVANVTAKQAARFHTIFNVLGIAWMLFFLTAFLDMVEWVNISVLGSEFSVFADDIESREKGGTQGLALFHSMFNIINVLLFIGFTPLMEKLVRKIQPSGEEDEEHHLTYISTGLMSTPELSLEQAKKETQLFADILRKMSGNMIALLYEKVKNYDKLTDKIKRREEITDRLEIELSNYLGRMAEGDINEATSKQIRSMLRMANDMESIGDIFYQQMINTQRLKKLKVEFSEEVKAELDSMFKMIDEGIKEIQEHLVDANLDDQRLLKATYEKEHSINDMRDKLQQKHYARLEEGKYTIEAGIIYLDYVNSLEKIGDHIVNVNEAIAGLK
jgi:phosphate:Na+ symporter